MEGAGTTTATEITKNAPEALVPVLQNITDQVRELEKRKPFKLRDVVKAHFNQKVVKGNPLVSVKDFATQLKENLDGMLQRFSNKEMTKRQIQQLNDFLNFNDALSQTIKDIFKARPEQYRHLDFTNYLVNVQGTFDDNTLNQVRFTPESRNIIKKF
ncbi:hypothetical protein [Acinetobacter piscicola]|uniref:hypothetical protein n=1 Tax=Acinetobacter piscicola TaxID=2006115 RepID=UPI0010215A6A|nr:hypothetical protein [Acinetobacter piscicola]RYL29661.1 hypothetical protein EWP19_02460 [Acinetobacter piscicola]